MVPADSTHVSNVALNYIWQFTVKSVADHVQEGELFGETGWLVCAATSRGGKLSDEEAPARWMEMSEAARARNRLMFQYGPRISLQLWAKTAKQVTFEGVVENPKEALLSEAPKKNITAEGNKRRKAPAMAGAF